MKISRNAPCPCGSGKKYKHCCLKNEQGMSPRAKLLAVLAGIASVGLVIFAVLSVILGSRDLEDQPRQRVWSEEHQHWHYVQ